MDRARQQDYFDCCDARSASGLGQSLHFCDVRVVSAFPLTPTKSRTSRRVVEGPRTMKHVTNAHPNSGTGQMGVVGKLIWIRICPHGETCSSGCSWILSDCIRTGCWNSMVEHKCGYRKR